MESWCPGPENGPQKTPGEPQGTKIEMWRPGAENGPQRAPGEPLGTKIKAQRPEMVPRGGAPAINAISTVSAIGRLSASCTCATIDASGNVSIDPIDVIELRQ